MQKSCGASTSSSLCCLTCFFRRPSRRLRPRRTPRPHQPSLPGAIPFPAKYVNGAKGQLTVTDSPNARDAASDGALKFYKRDFWIEENQKHVPPHFRLQKCARIVNSLAGGKDCELLDVGCGPATLMRLLDTNIRYYGIDIAIHDPAPNLIEMDFLERPIGFGDKRFDLVVAQGVFEYVGAFQDEKLSEIAGLLKDDASRFVLSYTNFGHHNNKIYEPFNNVRPFTDFRRSLERYFAVERYFPASHNWSGGQPTQPLVKAVNQHVSANIPVISPRLAVEYFCICAPR
jgi:SAM-dependent methyltransferase